jgi:hypothetical protein
MTGESMQAAMLTSFNPEEVKIITDAYALALKTFETNEPLSKIHQDALAPVSFSASKTKPRMVMWRRSVRRAWTGVAPVIDLCPVGMSVCLALVFRVQRLFRRRH